MAFTLEQGVKHSAIGCLVSECDPFKKSFLGGHSSLNNDATVQASDAFAHPTALEPRSKPGASPPFALAMSYEEVQGTCDGRSASGGASTPDVAPCTPCPSFLQQKSHGQKLTKMTHTLPSLCLGIGLLEGQQIPCIQRLMTPEKPSPSKEFLQLRSTSSPQSLFITPIQGNEARLEVQREILEPVKEALISSKLCKREQDWQEWRCQSSLGNFLEMPALRRSPENPKNLRYSFVEALTAGDTQFAPGADDMSCNRQPLSEGVGCLLSSSECPNNFESSLNKLLDQARSLTPTYETDLPWEVSKQANSGVFGSDMDAPVNSQACFLNAGSAVSRAPTAREEWSIALKQFPHLYGVLSEDKDVAISICDERKSPEKRRKLALQKKFAFGAINTWSEPNGSSDGLPYCNVGRQKSRNLEQLNAMEALGTISSQKANDWQGQASENFFRPVNLAKVKVEIDDEESQGVQYACGDSVEEDDESGRCNLKPLPEVGFLDSSSSGAYVPLKRSSVDMACTLQQTGSNLSVCMQLPQVLSTVSAGGPSVCVRNEQSQKLMDLMEQTPPMNMTSQTDGSWGRFLALSASAGRHTARGDSEVILPFQHRFKQLQEFLKQCDTSEKYSLQAFQLLSAAAMNSSAVELETRAVRLSLEEGKELKRMKLLNVLGKALEGLHTSSSGAMHGLRLPTLGNNVQVKHEI